MKRPYPRTLDHATDALLQTIAPQSLLARVQLLWPQAVGAAISAESRPVAERAGTLRVSCSSAVWAGELELLAPEVVRQLNQLLGSDDIHAIKCDSHSYHLP